MGYSGSGGYVDGYADLTVARAGIDPTVTIEWSPTTDPLETPVWEAVAGWRGITTNRGRQNEVDQIQPGTASIVLDNRDRRFDPLYSAGPYYGNVLPMKRFRIRSSHNGITHDEFQGFVESWDQSYVNPRDATVEVRLVDFFDVLNNVVLPDSVYMLEVVADNPTYWWRLGEPSDSTTGLNVAPSSTGGQPSITYQGPVTFGTAGAIANEANTAISLDGSDAYLTAGSTRITAFPYTIELWLKLAERTTTGNTSFFGQGRSDSVANPVDPHGFVTGVDLGDPGKVWWDGAQSTVRIDDNRWHHVVLKASAVGAGQQELVIDGASQGTFTSTTLANASEIVLGHPSFPNFGAISYKFWPGSIDEVAIYPTALSNARISAHYEAGTAPWEGDTTVERVDKLLDLAGVDAADRDVDTDTTSILQAVQLGGSILSHLQAVNVVEQGLLFMTKDGKVRFRTRMSGFNAASSATFGDGTGELSYTNLAFDYSKNLIANIVRRQNIDGEVMEAFDDTSIGRYGQRVDEKSGLIGASDLDALDLANYRLSKSKEPVLRITAMDLAPERDPANLYPQVLGREIGDQVTINRRPQGVGSAISFDARIEGIAHTITPETWATTFRLSPADTAVYLQLDLTSGPGLDSLALAY